MMAITANADYAETFQILPQIFSEFITDDEEVDLNRNSKKIKNSMNSVYWNLWQLVEKLLAMGTETSPIFYAVCL